MDRADGVVETMRTLREERKAKVGADLAAALVAAGKPDGPARTYEVSCRIASRYSTDKHLEEWERRDMLIQILETLEPLERHVSTSTWIVASTVREGQVVADILGGALDGKLDYLQAVEITGNRGRFGSTDLKP